MHFNALWVRLKIYRIEINGTVARLGRGYKTKKNSSESNLSDINNYTVCNGWAQSYEGSG